MKTVWKYPLGMGPNSLMLPKGALVAQVAMQNDFPHIWVEVPGDVNLEYEERRLEIFGTGHPIPDDAWFRGTFFDGEFVWHLYEHEALLIDGRDDG